MNDDDASLSAMATWVRDNLGARTPWHVTRFLPDFELSYLAPTPIRVLERGVTLGHAAGLSFVYVGNVPGHPGKSTVCPGCGRTVVERGDLRVERLQLREGLCDTCGEDLGIVPAVD
jgi:pyruvate formate lyase activating enzyme